jgi:hypothetical protein
MNASGGIGYHLAALRYTSRLWKPFREDLARELVLRFPKPETTDLVIIGPSGGYCLEASFLARFRGVLVVDIDRIALAILKFRFGPQVRIRNQDFFESLERAKWDLTEWLREVGAPTGSTLLFSNLLGQLAFLYKPDRLREIEIGLSRALASGPSWVSFHDRFSVEVGATARTRLSFESRPESDVLAEAWVSKWPDRAGALRNEWNEHELGGWTATMKGPFAYLPWRLDSRHTQLIEISGSGA